MNRLWSTLALGVLLAALGGYIYFVDMKKPADGASTKEKAFAVSSDAIDELTIASSSGDTTRLQKSGGTWQIVEPVKADADGAGPSAIATSLSSLEIERVLDEKPTDVKEYGLEPPRMTVAFTAGGDKTPKRLLLGDKTPGGGELYARRDGDPRVFLLASFLETTFNKTTFDLRDKSIIAFDRGKVDRIELARGTTTLQFTKQGEVEWGIAKPIATRGDFGAIDGLLNTLSSTQVQKFIAPESPDLATYGLDKPEARVTLSGGGTERSLVLGSSIEGTRYAKDSGRPWIFTVGENLVNDLRKELVEFRRKDVFDFRAFSANQVQFQRDTDPVTLKKTKNKAGEDAWQTAAGKDLETAKAEDPLSKFSNLRADAFEETLPPAWVRPTLTVTATFDDSKKTEIVRFSAVGDVVYATRSDDPGAMKVPKAAFDEAVKALDTLK